MKIKLKDWVLIIAGSLLMAVAMRLFLVPNRIAPGGVSGLATVLYYITGWPTGAVILAINLPLFILAAFLEGWEMVGNTLLSVVVMSLGTDYLPIPPITDNLLVSSLFGGVLLGYGLGLALKAGGNSGGTALLSQLIHRLVPHISIAWVMFGVDFIVVALSLWIFNIEIALYALIALYVSSEVIDRVIEGFVSGKSIYIITDEPEHMANRIMMEVERGCTRIDGHGMFLDEPRSILLCILKNSRELVQVKRIIGEVDKRSFVFVSDVREVMGEGFARRRGH
jgi:uncharacterized membrane-anchored protein YitT (DUF2179 family)